MTARTCSDCPRQCPLNARATRCGICQQRWRNSTTRRRADEQESAARIEAQLAKMDAAKKLRRWSSPGI